MKKPVKRSRKIDMRCIRPTQTYDLTQLASAANRELATVWRWRREGMPTIPGSGGKLVDGADFKAWAKARANARKRPLKIDEFYCFDGQCRTQRTPAIGSVYIRKSNQKLCSVEAQCHLCGAPMKKGWSMDNVAQIEAALESFMGNVQDLARYRSSPSNHN